MVRPRCVILVAFVLVQALTTDPGTCECVGGKGYGSVCARWDAPDEKFWCRVKTQSACGERHTYRSGAYFWSPEPCHGKGLPFSAERSARGLTGSGSPDHRAHVAKHGVPSYVHGEAVDTTSCVPKPRNPGEPITVLVTSTSQPYMYGSKRRNYEHTMWAEDSKIKHPLWVYHENTWDRLHGRPTLNATEVPVANCFIDVFDALPGMLGLITEKDSHIDELYRITGVRGLSDHIKDGKALIRKLAALYHAASMLPDGALIVWADVDTSMGAAFDKPFYDFVMSRDVTYIPEMLCRSELKGKRTIEDLPRYCIDYRVESGVLAINLSSTTRSFLLSALKWYDGRMLRLARECLQSRAASPVRKCSGSNLWRRNNIGLNDIYVLAQVLHDQKGLRHGWFANECSGTDLGMCQPCASASPDELVSPFNVRSYIYHRKGGTGLMAVQHDKGRVLDAREEKIRDKMKSQDPEMLLPFPNGQRSDPRPACGYEHLRPECIHSIACKDSKLRTADVYPDYKPAANSDRNHNLL